LPLRISTNSTRSRERQQQIPTFLPPSTTIIRCHLYASKIKTNEMIEIETTQGQPKTAERNLRNLPEKKRMPRIRAAYTDPRRLPTSPERHSPLPSTSPCTHPTDKRHNGVRKMSRSAGRPRHEIEQHHGIFGQSTSTEMPGHRKMADRERGRIKERRRVGSVSPQPVASYLRCRPAFPCCDGRGKAACPRASLS
jgi:hypothetical protein